MTAPKVPFEVVPIESLHEFPNNPRVGDVDAIRESIRENGLRGALTVQRKGRRVLSGNHTLRAALAEGVTEVPVKWEDVDDRAAKRIVLAFNRAADLGYYDNDLLASDEWLGGYDGDDDLLGTLYSAADREVLLDTVRDQPGNQQSGGGGGSGQTDDTRSVVLPMDGADYVAVIDGLAKLREWWGLDTNAEVMVRLVADAVAAGDLGDD